MNAQPTGQGLTPAQTGDSPPCLAAMPQAPSRQQIDTIEAGLLQLPQVEIPVQHRFAEQQGLYAREIVIPKDALMTGRVHKHQHVSIMISGDMTVLTETGMQRVKGYHCWICPPGTKRVGYAHEETRWLTVHHTDHMQPEGIEDALCEPMQIQPAHSELARADFQGFLTEYAVDTALMQLQVQDESDQTPFSGAQLVEVKASGIDGQGVFMTQPIAAGQVIAVARVEGKRTPAGRYTNHAPFPNAEMRLAGADVELVALTNIDAGNEVLVDYRQVLAAVNGVTA